MLEVFGKKSSRELMVIPNNEAVASFTPWNHWISSRVFHHVEGLRKEWRRTHLMQALPRVRSEGCGRRWWRWARSPWNHCFFFFNQHSVHGVLVLCLLCKKWRGEEDWELRDESEMVNWRVEEEIARVNLRTWNRNFWNQWDFLGCQLLNSVQCVAHPITPSFWKVPDFFRWKMNKQINIDKLGCCIVNPLHFPIYVHLINGSILILFWKTSNILLIRKPYFLPFKFLCDPLGSYITKVLINRVNKDFESKYERFCVMMDHNWTSPFYRERKAQPKFYPGQKSYTWIIYSGSK